MKIYFLKDASKTLELCVFFSIISRRRSTSLTKLRSTCSEESGSFQCKIFLEDYFIIEDFSTFSKKFSDSCQTFFGGLVNTAIYITRGDFREVFKHKKKQIKLVSGWIFSGILGKKFQHVVKTTSAFYVYRGKNSRKLSSWFLKLFYIILDFGRKISSFC